MNLDLDAIRRRFALVHANGVLNQDEEQDVAALCDEVERLHGLLQGLRDWLGPTHREQVSARLAIAQLRSTNDRLAKERDEARAIISGLLWQMSHVEDWRIGLDHACAECVPHSDMLVDGFLCSRHKAIAMVGEVPDKRKPKRE